jgi:predicted acyltransferase
LNRLTSLDATRGAAMFMVCVSHFGLAYFGEAHVAHGVAWTYVLGLVASPTFMIISGSMLGYLFHARPAQFESFSLKLYDRGLFLLLVAHWLIWFAHRPLFDVEGVRGHWFFITDVIGCCLLLGPVSVKTLRPRVRFVLAVVLFVGSWAIHWLWRPEDEFGLWLQDIVGTGYAHENRANMFPLMPWLAVYLVGTLLGERLFVWQREGRTVPALTRLGALLFALGATLRVSNESFRVSPWHHWLFPLTSHGQKFPPGPAYLFVYGGLGLLLLAGMTRLDSMPNASRFLAPFKLFGRTSLFVFVTQYYVFYAGFFSWKLPYTPLWPLYLLAAVGLLLAGSRTWERYGLSRTFTVGLPWLWHRVRARRVEG